MNAWQMGLFGVGAVILYGLGALFMHNTHPFAGAFGARRESFERKKLRRSIGIVLIVAGTLLFGILLLMLALFVTNRA